MKNPLILLPLSILESLRAGFANGSLKYGVSREALIHNGSPSDTAQSIGDYILKHAFTSEQSIALIDTVLETHACGHNLALSQSLVVTGPSVPHSENLKTGSRFLQIIEHAKTELMLGTFAIYRGDQILAPIHKAMARNPSLKVTLVLNIPRGYGDTTLASELIEKFRQNFWKNSWPWEPKPSVYYFPDSLLLDAKSRASMHAKFLIADEERCFITSANFTEAAQKRNIEIGVELSNSLEPKALSRYFKGLIEGKRLAKL